VRRSIFDGSAPAPARLELRCQPPATKVIAHLSKPVSTGLDINLHSSPLQWTFASSPRFICGAVVISHQYLWGWMRQVIPISAPIPPAIKMIARVFKAVETGLNIDLILVCSIATGYCSVRIISGSRKRSIDPCA
jgi:hypothetical protein